MTKDDVPSRFAVDFTGATLLGIYHVEKKIADGGMGSVWLGEDTNLGRKVVVKVPHVRFLGESGFRARFTQEITELVRLEHPNVVRIQAQGVHEEIPFFVLQYLGGGSLEDRLEEAGDSPRDLTVVKPWLRTIAETLDFVHGRGVVHRDVKPENILFDEGGHVFLSDFGVVKALDQELDVTAAGSGVGSPKYMAPEQGLGKGVDGAADQYGLATTVFEVIADRLPFEGDSAVELLMNKQNEKPIRLAELAPDVPAECADAVMRGLAADPRERFPSCQEFADAFLAGAGIFDRTPPTGVRAVRAPTPARWLAVAAVALLAAVVVAGFAAGWFSAETPTEVADEEEDTLSVVLLSPGAEPRYTLRYDLAAGARETFVVDVTSEESKQFGEAEPVAVPMPGVSIQMGISVTDVADDGEISYLWEVERMALEAPEDTSPDMLGALRMASKALDGTSGAGRQSARGISREFNHDTPPPKDPDLGALVAIIEEVASQVSTPLPEEPVGVGALWEVTTSKYHGEGMRFTQTVTYEIVSLEETSARLRMFIALAAPHQTFTQPEPSKGPEVRIRRAYGDGEGELVIDLARFGDRNFWMTVRSFADISVTDEEEETQMTLGRSFRYEMNRE